MPAVITPAALLDLILTEHIIEPDQPIGIDDNLFALGLDSMALMQLLLLIEDRHHIAIQPSDMTRERFASATALAHFLIEKQAASP